MKDSLSHRLGQTMAERISGRVLHRDYNSMVPLFEKDIDRQEAQTARVSKEMQRHIQKAKNESDQDTQYIKSAAEKMKEIRQEQVEKTFYRSKNLK